MFRNRLLFREYNRIVKRNNVIHKKMFIIYEWPRGTGFIPKSTQMNTSEEYFKFLCETFKYSGKKTEDTRSLYKGRLFISLFLMSDNKSSCYEEGVRNYTYIIIFIKSLSNFKR